MINRLDHYEAIVQGKPKENIQLSNISDARRKPKKRGEVEKCEADNCFVTLHDVNVGWVCCDTCDGWHHTMCEGLAPIEEVNVVDTEYICIRCSGVVDRSEVFTAKINTLIEEETILNHEIVNTRITCDDLKAKYSNAIGARNKSLNLALESIKVVRQAYHDNVMVGNHCIIVLEKFLVLTSVISDKEELHEKFSKIFEIFSNIMKLVMSRWFLQDHEISTLENLCIDFGKTFPIIFPKRNITHKMHELIFYVPSFVRKYRTVGMLSEQEGGSKHSAVNAELRPLANVRNPSERIRLLLEREELRSQDIPSYVQNCLK